MTLLVTQCSADRRQSKSAEKANPQKISIIRHGYLAAFLHGEPKTQKKYDCEIPENSHFQVCYFAMPSQGGATKKYNKKEHCTTTFFSLCKDIKSLPKIVCYVLVLVRTNLLISTHSEEYKHRFNTVVCPYAHFI